VPIPWQRTGPPRCAPYGSLTVPHWASPWAGYGEWGSIFHDPIVATAILGRLLHHSTTVDTWGRSYRLKGGRKAGLIPEPDLSAGREAERREETK
jgi:hypothetical protein